MIRKNRKFEKLIYILLAFFILCLLILGSIGSFFYTEGNSSVNRIMFSEYLLLESERIEGAHLDITAADENVMVYSSGQLPVYTEFENKMYTFKTAFELPAGNGDEDWALYTGLFEYPYQIYLNGYEIYRKGFYQYSRYNSSLRTVSSVYLSPDLLNEEEKNELVLEIYPAYETWGLDVLFVGTRANVAKVVFIRNFIGIHFLQGAFFLSLAIVIYFAALFLMIKGDTKKYLYFSFFSFFFCAVYFNVVAHYESYNEMLMESLSKSSMVLLSTSLLFFLKEFTQVLRGKKLLWGLIFLSGLVGFIAVFIQTDKESLLSVFERILYFVIIPHEVLASIIILYYGIKKKGKYFLPLLVSFTLIILTMIHDAYFFIDMTLPLAWMIPYGFFAMVVGIFVSLVDEQSTIYMTSIQQAYELEIKQEKNEELNRELVSLNNSLEEVVDKKTRDLKNTIDLLNYEIEEREKVSEQLREQASTDFLTGIMNRNYGISFLENQISLIGRRESCLVICYIDLNDLKKVNDTFGHKLGDEYIVNTARIVSAGLRKSDVLCRLGGDEFMAVFSDTSIDKAEDILQRILGLINDFNLQSGKPFKISISYGFSEFGEPWNKNVRELLEEADRRMYEAKKKYKERKGF